MSTTPVRTAKAAASTSIARSPAANRGTSNGRRVSDRNNWDLRLGFLMHDVSRLRRTVFDEAMKPIGVTRSQWSVLATLSRHDGMIQTDLARDLNLGKAALGQLLGKLETLGLIERRPDEIDGRARRVYLLGPSMQIIAKLRERAIDVMEHILHDLSPSERRTLMALLLKVKSNLIQLRDAQESLRT